MRLHTALAAILVASPAAASNGALQINAACAVETGCFTGDAAGYPVTIGTAGSYVLTGNLTLSDSATHAIQVNANNVSIDLNGFTISGIATCSGSPTSCSGAGSGRGVTAFSELVKGLRVHGGTITRMGDDGVFVGNYGRVEDVLSHGNAGDGIEGASGSHVLRCKASDNGGRGIHIQSNGIVADSVVIFTGAGQAGIGAGISVSVERNRITGAGGDGINAGSRALIRGNGVTSSGGDGIETSFGALVEANTLLNSTLFGLRFTSTESGYTGNVLSLNGGAVSGPGVNLGANLCSGVLCP
jgi:hypothetical protein